MDDKKIVKLILEGHTDDVIVGKLLRGKKGLYL
jgi:hypothetical protein